MTMLLDKREDLATVDEADAMDMTLTQADDLIAYADGRLVDEKTKALLDDMIIDYIDGELGVDMVRDVETLMRLFPSVARLIADKTNETHLQIRLSMFFDGELDPKDTADIRRMIDTDPDVAKLARQIRQGGDYLRLVLQPIPGQHVDSNDVHAVMAELIGGSDAGRRIARFSTFVAYAEGMVINGETQALLNDMILRYIGGTLDRRSALGVEASMRLASSVARLIADRTDEHQNLLGSTPNFRRQAGENRGAGLAPGQSQSVDST